MKPLVYITDPIFKEHNPGPFHPERPERITQLWAYLENNPLENIVRRRPEPAAREDLLRVHSREMIETILATRGKEQVVLDIGDTIAGPRSADAGLMAAGSTIAAVKAVFEEDYQRAFVAVRPPGHHAESNRIMGFCLFNNIAVAAAYALEKYGQRILIMDWDVHHGNGTQDIFYDSDRLFYVSIHQSPLFPGTGAPAETGRGAGEGYTLNFPLRPGLGDDVWCATLKEALTTVEQKFKPDLLMLSAGFDAHFNDPVGSMQVTEKGFADMTDMLCEFANKNCSGRFVSVLEGGYDLDGLSRSVHVHLKRLMEI